MDWGSWLQESQFSMDSIENCSLFLVGTDRIKQAVGFKARCQSKAWEEEKNWERTFWDKIKGWVQSTSSSLKVKNFYERRQTQLRVVWIECCFKLDGVETAEILKKVEVLRAKLFAKCERREKWRTNAQSLGVQPLHRKQEGLVLQS